MFRAQSLEGTAMKIFLGACQKVEVLAAIIYERLAAETSYAPWLCGVFRELATDERNHAQYIDMVSQASALEATPAVSSGVIDTAVRTAQEMLDTLDRHRLDEEEALRMAVKIEKLFIRVHVNKVVFSGKRQLVALFARLAEEDEAHIERLQRCIKRWREEKA